jgi:hypothetical protein
VEDAERLVHLPIDGEPEHDPLRTGLDELDTEEIVDARVGA